MTLARSAPVRPAFDVLLLFALLIARLHINAAAEASLFEHVANVTRHPWLGRLLSPQAWAAFGPWQGDAIFLLLAAISLLAFLFYALVDLSRARLGKKRCLRLKMGLLWLILLALVILPTLKLALLRHDNLPHSYSHDGGVIQTEVAITYFLAGRNPYVENYHDTPMTDWGFPEFRTALDHYPYLPATFLLSAPVKLLAEALLGWYDQRFTYLLLFLITLALLPRLAVTAADKLGLTMLVGLNPIMGLDLLFGQNDSFVLAWIVASVYALSRGRRGWAAIFLGVALASKPTAWFLAPFWALALLVDRPLSWRGALHALPTLARRAAPALAIFLLLTLPYLLWQPTAFIDDVWRWAAGATPTHYQIWGLGFANFVLASGALTDRFASWPFWLPELLATLPLLGLLLHRQLRHNGIAPACWHGGLLLFTFAYFSRFLNENYLGFLLALFALGYYLNPDAPPAAE